MVFLRWQEATDRANSSSSVLCNNYYICVLCLAMSHQHTTKQSMMQGQQNKQKKWVERVQAPSSSIKASRQTTRVTWHPPAYVSPASGISSLLLLLDSDSCSRAAFRCAATCKLNICAIAASTIRNALREQVVKAISKQVGRMLLEPIAASPTTISPHLQ
jgi:hypothetical protein